MRSKGVGYGLRYKAGDWTSARNTCSFFFFLLLSYLFITFLLSLPPPPPLLFFHGLLLGGEVGNWTDSMSNNDLLWLSLCFLSSVLSVARMVGLLQGYFLEKRARGDNQIVRTYEYHYSIGWMGVKEQVGLASMIGAMSGSREAVRVVLFFFLIKKNK